jgi:hypothetical protein
MRASAPIRMEVQNRPPRWSGHWLREARDPAAQENEIPPLSPLGHPEDTKVHVENGHSLDGLNDISTLEDVIVTAATWFGSDGLGKDGLIGLFSMLALTNDELFARVFANVARLELEAEAKALKRNSTRPTHRRPDLS